MLYLNSAMNPILYNLMSSKFRDGFLRLLHCKSLVKNRLVSGTRKGTFHTTSTNLSSSQSGDKRKSSRYREDTEYFDRSIKSRRSVDHSVDETSKVRIIEANSIANGNSNSYTKEIIRETVEEESTTDQQHQNDVGIVRHKCRSTKLNPKLQRLCNKSTSIESDAYERNVVDTKYTNGHRRTDVEPITPTERSFKCDSSAMVTHHNDNVEVIESPANNCESGQLNSENNCNKNHQHHDDDGAQNNGVRDEYQSFLCRKRDLESLV